VDALVGLSDAEVDIRLHRCRPNEVPERKPHPLREFLKKFWGLSAWMLELIMALSWVLGKYADLIIMGYFPTKVPKVSQPCVGGAHSLGHIEHPHYASPTHLGLQSPGVVGTRHDQFIALP
jgi:hypothetical protein